MKIIQRKRRKYNYNAPSGIIIELEHPSILTSSSTGSDANAGDNKNDFGIQLQDVEEEEIIP